ncbi:MAG: hypothetical protein WKF96_21295 [Solirubrobacteraceae bacterium]
MPIARLLSLPLLGIVDEELDQSAPELAEELQEPADRVGRLVGDEDEAESAVPDWTIEFFEAGGPLTRVPSRISGCILR